MSLRMRPLRLSIPSEAGGGHLFFMSSLSLPFLPNLLSRLPEPPKKIIVLRASRIGDFICATPAFRALRAALPDAEITLIGLPFVRELAVRSTSFDKFVEFCGFPGIAEQLFDARKTTSFFERMQAQKFDLAIQMHGTGVYSNPFVMLLGAKATAGFIRRVDRAGRLDAALPMPSKGHEINRLLALTSFLGAGPLGETPEFPLEAKDRRAAQNLLASAEPPLIGLHPFARDPQKCWPIINFMRTAEQLRSRHGGTVVLIGGAENGMAASAVAEALDPACLDLTGKAAVTVSGAVISRLAVLITNDSAPAHIAYTLHTPTVTVFMDTDPSRWGPPQAGPFQVVRSLPEPARSGSRGVNHQTPAAGTVEQVVEAAERVMRM